MSKELEAFKKIAIGTIVDTKRISIDEMDNCLKIIENGLKRLAKYEAPPKRRYYVYYERLVHLKSGKEWITKKVGIVETLESESLKDHFEEWNKTDGEFGKCLIVIIKDKWNNNKLIYKGNDYEEFKRKCLK